jgi:hypothetical protein
MRLLKREKKYDEGHPKPIFTKELIKTKKPQILSGVFGSANTIPTQKKTGLNCLFLSQNQQMVDSN